MVEKKNLLMRVVQPLFFGVSYLFLYIPIVVIVLFSFNHSSVGLRWTGFSLKWYAKLFSSPEILDALSVSLIVAFSSTFLSLLIGASLVISSKWWKPVILYGLFYPNIILADIVLAVGILSIFTFLNIPLGYGSLIVGHTLIGIGFVVPIVRARFAELDPVLTESSLDLGATYFQTFRKVIIPLLAPSLIASAMIVFTLSLDDFLIAFFCSSPTLQTLSLYVYAQIREVVDPSINAISTLMLVISSIGIFVLFALKVVDQVIDYE